MKVSNSKFEILEEGTNRVVNEVCFKDVGNVPIGKSQNIPLDALGQCENNFRNEPLPSRGYIKTKCIEALAISRYQQNGRGISFNDLLSNRLAKHKEQAQAKLKYCLRTEILFTPHNRKPQQYYPTCFKSEILNKIIPVKAIGVGLPRPPLLEGNHKGIQPIDFNHHELDSHVVQALERYVLPLLPEVPMQIHKMHFKTKIRPECYQEIVLPANPWNKGKEHEEIIGCTRAKYRFYANGTVVVSTESSNNPFRLATESDCSNLMAFLGQLRDRLVLFLADKHERIVPGIMSWELTQCDINKDVRIERWLQFTGLSIQVKHLSHLFRVYIKSMGGETVCRVEESITPKDESVVKAINNIFNPTERLEKQIAWLDRKIDRLLYGANIVGSKNPKLDGSDIFDDNYIRRSGI